MMGMPMMNMQQMMGMSQGPAVALERTVFCLTKSLLLKAGSSGEAANCQELRPLGVALSPANINLLPLQYKIQ